MLVTFMATLPPTDHVTMFAKRAVCVVENFPPYIFARPNAASRWEKGFRKHATDAALTELAVEFGPAQDFGVSGCRAFFTPPTIWTGRSAGRPFKEQGAWSFVLTGRRPAGRSSVMGGASFRSGGALGSARLTARPGSGNNHRPERS